MKACLIIPYFGRWPSLFPLYLESCRRNPGLDIRLFTDLRPPDRLPANVSIEVIRFDQLQRFFAEKLQVAVCLPRPYKLCDFRPAYGRIFEDYLADYDFWGHGDIDVVYGDLAAFLKPDILRNFDVISCRREWISGSFCLYRNCPEVNDLFKASRDYIQVFGSRRHMAFDESSFRWREMKTRSVFEIDFPYSNMTLLVKQAHREGRLRSRFETLAMEDIPEGSHVRWDDGRVFHAGKEYMYYHAVTERRLGKLIFPDWRDAPQRFYITPYGFYRENQFRSPGFAFREHARKAHYRYRRTLSAGKRLLNSIGHRLRRPAGAL